MSALIAAMAKTATLGTEVAVICKARNLDVIDAMQKNVTPIENTGLDAAADVLLEAWFGAGKEIPQVAALVAVAAGVASTGSIRGDLYRRGAQHVFWRAFGKAGRAIFRGLTGK